MKSVYLEWGTWLPYVASIFDGVAEVGLGKAGDDHEAAAARSGANGLLISSRWMITGDVLDRLPAVEVVARPGIGYDNVDVGAATERGVAVVNAPDGPTESTAEHTVMLMLAAARRLKQLERATRELRFQWTDDLKGVELAGKTLGLVGLGRIGRRVAQICSDGLRMRVLGFDPYVSDAQLARMDITRVACIEEMLPQVDFLSLHAPPGPETRNLMHAGTLALLKRTAFVINCARGALVDEEALADALESGRLAGAALDVFEPEPPEAHNRLLRLDNVVLTPHVGSFTEDGIRAMMAGAAEQVVDVFRGCRPRHLLNPDVWGRPNRRFRS